MITSLKLKNFKSHEDTYFEFGPGTNVLVGVMGSGKSSVMDAVCMALFGTFPALQSRRIRLDDIIMNRPSKKNSCEISLKFRNEGKEYTVRRVVERGKGNTHSELREDGKLVESPNQQRVNELVENILGINYDLFYRAVYGEQNQLDYFLRIPRGRRKQQLDELLKISKFEDARKNTVSVLNRIVELKEDRKIRIEKWEETVKPEKICSMEKEIETISAGMEEQKEKLKVNRESLAEVTKDIEVLEEKGKTVDEIKKRQAGLEAQIKQLNEELAGIDLDRYSVQDKEEKVQTLVRAKTELSEIGKEVGELGAKIQNLKENIPKLLELEKEKQELKKYLDFIAEEYGDISKRLREFEVEEEVEAKRIYEFKARIKEIGESITRLQETVGECPVCGTELPPEKKIRLLEQRRYENKKHIEDVKELENKQKELRERVNRIREEEKKHLKARERLRSIREEDVNELKQKLSEFESMREQRSRREKELEEQVARLEEQVKKLEKASEAVKKKDKRDALTEALEGINLSLETIQFDETALKKGRAEREDLIKSVEGLESDIKHKDEFVREKKSRLDDLKKQKQELDNFKREIERAESAEGFLEQMSTALSRTQVLLRERFMHAINEALSEIWVRVYPYADYTALRLNVRDADYSLELRRMDGQWVSVEGETSGGERSSACLALRIALALVLTQNLSWIILDEPTHNIDRRGVKELATTLRDHLPGIVEQIFLITHDQELESAASAYLYVLERDKDANESTRVVKERGGESDLPQKAPG